MINFFQKILYTAFLLLIIFNFTNQAQASIEVKNTFPRLANYFLKWEISDYEAESLAKWDLLILDMEVQENSPEALKKIRRLNPDVIILAYITAQEIMDDFKYYHLAHLRPKLKEGINDSWYLKDEGGNKISNWPGTYMLNLSNKSQTNQRGQRFNDYLPEFVANNIKAAGLWDGVFYDNTWGDLAWVNKTDIDLDNDGCRETTTEINSLWAEGFKKMLDKTRTLVGPDFLIIGNGKIYEPYQSTLNGMMFENFPAFWEGDGIWASSMNNYLKLPSLNTSPSLSIINTYNKDQNNFELMRFGLSSTLLGDGFFSYDYDTTNHAQLWWYDEYDINLGRANSQAYNLLNNSKIINNSVFRRDFEDASVFVNASSKREIKIFSQESFSKPKGNQDSDFNNGERINFLELQPNTGAILIKNDKAIKNSTFTNGYFYRFLDGKGTQIKPATFSFLSAYPGSAEIIALTNNNFEDTIISASAGLIKVNGNGHNHSFRPFPLFKNGLSLAVSHKNGFLDKIVVGPGQGGGPQVLVFSAKGKLEGNFFAYDKNLRTGVNVAAVDLDGDGKVEIITTPGRGTEPLVKIFSLGGELKFSFLAYDKNFRGGVSLAAGDMNLDGKVEIVTIPSSGGGPHVRVFNHQGKVVGGFFAYSQDQRDKFEISLSDINDDGNLEILVGRQNPY